MCTHLQAFYAAIDAGGRRSTRERRPPTLDEGYMHPDFEVADDDDYGSKSKRKSAVKAIPWTTDADDALLSAIVKHGEGHWTNMVTDPEFASRLAGHKATQLRARWRKLGTSEFNAKSEPADRHLAAKRDSVLDHIEATKPLPIQPSVAAVHYAPVQPQPQMMMAHPQMGVAPVAGASALPTPPPEPFTAYRPYVTHIFDLPKSTKAKKPVPGESAADAQLSTPMTGQPKARRRGRRPNNSRSDDESEFSDADSEDSEAVERRAATVAQRLDWCCSLILWSRQPFDSCSTEPFQQQLQEQRVWHRFRRCRCCCCCYLTILPVRDLCWAGLSYCGFVCVFACMCLSLIVRSCC